ncbi:MAG: DMT family transporter [Chloroflexi bacterium]|nr:DMT family transporter [Chloroflexota bacterium]
MDLKTSKINPTTPWQWYSVAIISQLLWGMYPVLLRYLQTVSQIPSLSLLAVGNLTVLLIVGVRYWPRIDKKYFRLRIVWLFGLMVLLRGVTNLLATRFTLAIYAQLIYLMTPFVVALISRVILREPLPKNTIRALVICLVGALMIMSGNVGTMGETAVSRNDWVGITLAIASTIALAIYMIVVRRSRNHQAPSEVLLIVHLISLSSIPLIGSFILQENWAQWQSLTLTDWGVFVLFSLGVLFSGNLAQIRSIQQLGAPLVSSLMASRLVSALLFGALLLGERFTSVWQILGAGIVIITITWYLRQQT